MGLAESGASAFAPYSASRSAGNTQGATSASAQSHGAAAGGAQNGNSEYQDETENHPPVSTRPETPGDNGIGAYDMDVESPEPNKTQGARRRKVNSFPGNGEEDDEAEIGVMPKKMPALARDGSYSSDSEDSEEADDWTEFAYTVTDAGDHLTARDKTSSEVFNTYNGWPWRIGVHWNGVQSQVGLCVSVFVELGDVDFRTRRNDISLPETRPARFTIDVVTNRPDKMLFSEFARRARRGEIEGISPKAEEVQNEACGSKAGLTRFHVSNKTDCGFSAAISREAISRFCLTSENTITFVARVIPVPGSVGGSFDSKRNTGMVGLLNQGATCYLNSLLQTLYHTRALRSAVYALDTSKERAEDGVAYELQHLFADLQTKTTAVSTQALTKAFGWTDSQVFTQHDVQELLRELLDKLEERMKGTRQASVIKDLFCGQFATYIKCINVSCERSREEEFFDLQLDVRGARSVMESFQKYVQEERLEKDNQYDAEGFGKQDAIKGVKFLKFPPVLHLHLKRFAYNYEEERSYKIHDRFEFSETLDLAPFLPADNVAQEGSDYVYRLHSVLVHSGNDQRGHYYAYVYLDSLGKSKPRWFKFDDEAVSRVMRRVAVQRTFGTGPVHLSANGHGVDGNTLANEMDESSSRLGIYAAAANLSGLGAAKRMRTASDFGVDSNSSAYMLVYVRQKLWAEVMRPIVEVPSGLQERFENDIRQKQLEKERAERTKYLGTVRVATWDDVKAFTDVRPTRRGENDDWVAWDSCKLIEYGDTRHATFADLHKAVRDAFPHLREGKYRLWTTCERDNYTCRIDEEIAPIDKLIKLSPFNKKIYLEESEGNQQITRLGEDDLSLLFREYDPELPGIVRGSGKMVFGTGLFVDGRSNLAELWDCLASQVLGVADVDLVKAEYALYELATNSNTDPANIRELDCSTERMIRERNGHEFLPVGDIVLFCKRCKRGLSVLEYFREICHSATFIFKPLYPGITEPALEVRLDGFDDMKIDRDLIPALCSKLGADLDPARIELSVGESRERMDPHGYSWSALRAVFNIDLKSKRADARERDPMFKPTIYYDVLCKPRSEMDELRSVRVLLLSPQEGAHSKPLPVTSSVPLKRTTSGVSNPSLRWDHPFVERLFVGPSTTGAQLYRELLSRQSVIEHLRGGEYELVLFVVSREGAIDREVGDDDEPLGSDQPRICLHGVSLIGEDGFPTMPNFMSTRSDSARLVGEFVYRPPVEPGKHVFKLLVAHCTMRDEGMDPMGLGLPSVTYIVEGDTLGSFWTRVLSRLHAPSELSATWRPLLCSKASDMSRVVLLDVRTAPANGEGDQEGVNGDSFTGGASISLGSQLSNVVRAKNRPRVPQDEYDGQPLWTRPALQNALTSSMLSTTDVGDAMELDGVPHPPNGVSLNNGAEDTRRDEGPKSRVLPSIVFYIRHPSASASATVAPNRTSTPVLSIRSSTS